MTDLVMLSLESWDDVWRRNQHVVSRLLRLEPDLRVLFVEPAADPLHAIARARRPTMGHGPRPVEGFDRLWTMVPLKALPRRIHSRADTLLSAQVERAARALRMPSPVLWVNDPSGATVAERTGWPALYDMTDDWLAADRPRAEKERIDTAERFLIEAASEVVACSPELERRKAPFRPAGKSPIVVIRNGVDVEMYRAPRSRPADLPVGQIAVYCGTLHEDRLDVELCRRTARELDGTAQLVLVGPDSLTSPSRHLLAAAGVSALGPKPYPAVIAYMQHADVLVVPHVVSEFTESLDPIKLYEYLAIGKPIVSTPVAGFREASAVGVNLAPASEFAERVAAELAGVDDAVSDVAQPSLDWTSRVSQFQEVLLRARGTDHETPA